MSSLLFIALPLLFSFATPIIDKLGKNAVAYMSTIMQVFLLYIGVTLLIQNNPHIEIISIAPPLGISFVLNSISLFFVVLFSFLMSIFSFYYLSQRKTNAYRDETKFFILLNMLLASAIGLVLSSDIFNIYVFFEIAGITAYILTSYKKTAQALEAALKYLITGAIASIFIVFAITLIYLHIGSLNLAIIAQNFQFLPYNIKLLISVLLFIGFGFKVEIFPLNFWIIDVYQGSTSLVNALFSGIVVKAYLFVFFHVVYLMLPHGEFSLFLIYIGAISMLVAEIVALKQTNLKRLFAYSSIGQVGLIFTAFALQNVGAIQAALFIVVSHSIAKLTIFLALSRISLDHKSFHIDILKELNSPFLRAIILIAMLSLLGIPLFAGFIGKLLVLKSLASGGFISVMFIIMFASFIEAIYYFKLAGFMFSKTPKNNPLKVNFSQKIIFSTLAFLLILIGSAPYLISDYLSHGANTMLNSTEYILQLLGAN